MHHDLIARASSLHIAKTIVVLFACCSLLACGDDQDFSAEPGADTNGERSELILLRGKSNAATYKEHPHKENKWSPHSRGTGKRVPPGRRTDHSDASAEADVSTPDAGDEPDVVDEGSGREDAGHDSEWGSDSGSDDWNGEPRDAGTDDAGSNEDTGAPTTPDADSTPDAGASEPDTGSGEDGAGDFDGGDWNSGDAGSNDTGGWTPIPDDQDSGSGSSDAGEGAADSGTTYACADNDSVCGTDCDFTNDNDCVLDCRDASTWPESWVAIEDQVLQLTNAERAAGATCDATYYPPQPALTFNAKLREAARCHSLDMAMQNFFSHTSSNGDRLTDRINATGYNWRYISENIAVGFGSPSSVVSAWMNSPGHCHNVMSTNTELGVGYVYGADGGTRKLWTQDYGTPY